MAYSTYGNYLETEIDSADPVKLVCMLYRGAIDATAAARRHLKAGEIRERSRRITKAMEIVTELSRSLDHQVGGELSRSLAGLYAYIIQKLIDGNVQQSDAPLAEAEALLSTLHEAWSNLPVALPPPPVAYEPISCSY